MARGRPNGAMASHWWRGEGAGPPASLAPGGVAPDRRDRDMRHGRIRLGPVPMPLTRLDLHDVTHLDLALLVFGRDIASAQGHDQELVAIMRMPSGITPLTKVHHTTVVVGGVPRGNDGLPRAGHGACPACRLLSSAFRGKQRKIVRGHNTHRHVSLLGVYHVDVLLPYFGASTVPQRCPAWKPCPSVRTDGDLIVRLAGLRFRYSAAAATCRSRKA